MNRKPVVNLEDWSLFFAPCSDPYTAPETLPTLVGGRVYNHPMHEDGQKVVTSAVVNAKGKRLETQNTIYVLGEPDMDYALWCEERGTPIDMDNPIK